MIDQIIVGLYLVITLVVGLYVGSSTNTVEDFAIGKRNFSNIALISTIFASVVDAGMTTGLASSTYQIGPIFLWSFMGIVFSNINVSFLIAPRMKPFLGLLSSGDIFQKLYGKRAKTLMGCSTIIESTLTAAIQILAITHISQYFFGFPPVITSVVVTMIIVIYSFRGGIRSVTATDVFQFGIMVIAIPIMCGIALSKIGGLQAITHVISENKFYFPGQNNGNHFEYLAVFLSFSLPCLYPLCIQRMLMAKSTQQIRSTFLINGLLSLPFYLTIGLIGIIAFIAIPGTDPNIVFPSLINTVLPIGIKGLVLAGLIAIFMSTIDSILNIGSIAIIHDVLGSLTKKELDPKTELKLMKSASLLIALSAVAICHLFVSVMDIVFFLMVIGNSIFFPGFFWGILGFKSSKTGFWVGVGAGALTVLICTFGVELFPLYTMLIAITVNSSIFLIDALLEKPLRSLQFSSFLDSDKRYVIQDTRRNNFLKDLIKNQDYCTIFLVCAIAVSLSPFFFASIHGLASFDSNVLTISILTAIASFAMLFRELWWERVGKLFPIIWMLILTTALPVQSCYLLFKSDFSWVWLADCLIILPLMFLLITRNAVFISFGSGFLIALVLTYLSSSSLTPSIAVDFGYLALMTHFVVLAICLALFRKHDYETFVLNSSTLAHEVSRSFLAFENAACYLNKYLPEVVTNYRPNLASQTVSLKALDELLALPSQLENAAKRSRYIVEKLSFFSIASRSHFEIFDIAICINSAVTDPSIKKFLQEKLELINYTTLTIKGDINQTTQVIINLLENALHATSNKPKSIIQIIVDKNVVIVRDTGEGIHKVDLPNIFDDRFSTKSTKGQGLAFCKSVMKNHGGTIDCSSVHGEFTEFRLHFPTINHG